MNARNIDQLIDDRDEELLDGQMRAYVRAVQPTHAFQRAYRADQRKTPDELALDIALWEAR